MAKKKNNRYDNQKNSSSSRKKFHRRNKYTPEERAAWMQGRVERGLNNPDSRIAESYKNGLASVDKKKAPKKSLF